MNALLKKAAAELVGVAVFLTAIISSTSTTFNHTPGFANVALAGTLAVMILITAGISGGHLNPAVSLYFFAKKALSLGELVTYVAAQLLGAVAGVALGSHLSGQVFAPAADAVSFTGIELAGEVFATAILVWIVGHLAATDQGSKIPAAVGVWVLAASLYTPTGAQANPAVTFGLLFHGKSVSYAGGIILAELAGALLGLIAITFISGAAKKTAAKKKSAK